MSTDRDVTRIVRSWLHEDAYEDADRILDLVLDEIDTTPQRRASVAGAEVPAHEQPIQIVLAGAALAAVVAAGVIFLPRDGGNTGGPVPTPTPAASPIPLTDQFLPLAPGTYVGSEMLVPVAFTVPDGWEGKIGGPYLVDTGIRGKPSGLLFAIFDKVAANVARSAPVSSMCPGRPWMTSSPLFRACPVRR